MASSVSIYVIILVAISTLLNSLSIGVLYRELKKNTKSIRHALLLSLAVSDICTGIIGFPLEMFQLSTESCIAAGYLVTLFSLVSITHMCALAVERCLSIARPFLSMSLSEKRSYFAGMISVCWFYGTLWATLPMTGWGAYGFESRTNHRCSIVITTRDSNIMSYNYALLVFCYVIPIIVMVVSLMIAKRAMLGMVHRIQTATGKNSKQSNLTAKQERLFTIVVLVMLASFVTAWTPYAICVFLASIDVHVSAVALDVSAYLGKSAIIHNPIIYVFLYKQFRVGLLRVLLVCLRIDVNSVYPMTESQYTNTIMQTANKPTNDNSAVVINNIQ